MKSYSSSIDIRSQVVKSCATLFTKSMWPVMTLTLLLQLTDDEQLYAQVPSINPTEKEVSAPAQPAPAPAIAWPGTEECAG
jgi:hypothetical protein